MIRRAGLRAKRMFHEQLSNPDTSEEHRKEIRKKLEELELMVGKRELKRIEAMILEISKHDGTKG